jgi:O-antigen ligase
VKWIILALMAFAALASPSWLRRRPERLHAIGFLVGFSPLLLGEYHTNMAVISWKDWPGYVKGIEVSVLDFLVVATFLTLPRLRHRLPFAFPMAAYFAVVLLSVLQSGVPMASLFYCWQLLKLFFLYKVIASACEDRRFADAVLRGLGAAVIVEAYIAGSQHFVQGLREVTGTEGSKNELGMLTDLVVFPVFALFLSGRSGWLAGATLASAPFIAVLTGSRAAIGLGGIGYAAILGLSLLGHWTRRKSMILLFAAVVATIVGVAAFISLSQRSAAEFEGSDEERVTFERAAAMMLADHPFGVGANQYVIVANVQDYNRRAGVIPVPGSESANVHNVYRLVAAETGYLGLATYLVLLASCLIYVSRRAWRYRNDRRGDLLLGIAISFCIIYVHGLYEWVFITFRVQDAYCILLALSVGISNQLAHEGRIRKDAVRIRPRSPAVSRIPGVAELEPVPREIRP